MENQSGLGLEYSGQGRLPEKTTSAERIRGECIGSLWLL